MLGHEIRDWNPSTSTHKDFEVDDLKGKRFKIRAGLQDENYTVLQSKHKLPRPHSGMKSRHVYNFNGWNNSVAPESIFDQERTFKKSREINLKHTQSQNEIILQNQSAERVKRSMGVEYTGYVSPERIAAKLIQ